MRPLPDGYKIRDRGDYLTLEFHGRHVAIETTCTGRSLANWILTRRARFNARHGIVP